jgi:hypothetical protein
MGYLGRYEHDIFVSYAHAEALNDWSKRWSRRRASLWLPALA